MNVEIVCDCILAYIVFNGTFSPCTIYLSPPFYLGHIILIFYYK